MAEAKLYRLSQAARQLNVGTSTIAEFLERKGFDIDNKPNSKITQEQFDMLQKEFQDSLMDKEEASGLEIGTKRKSNVVLESDKAEDRKSEEEEEIVIKNVATGEQDTDSAEELTSQKLQGIKVVGKIDLDAGKPKKKEEPKQEEKKEEVKKEEAKKETPKKEEEPEKEPDPTIEGKADSLKGLTVVGKIDLPEKKEKPKKNKKEEEENRRKRKRVRISYAKEDINKVKSDKKKGGKKSEKEDVSDKEIQEKIKSTLAKLGGTKSGKSRAKYRKEKRSAIAEKEKQQTDSQDSTLLKLTEFISANDLASLMDVNVNEIISTCMNLGLFVSINQRLDAETITIIADEFGYSVEFISAEEEQEKTIEEIQEEDESQLEERAPIVTIMGHVDHGKTTLLDYVKKSDVAGGEAGGITQHIGAYNVSTSSGKRITFLDTPGHEAFTAMRARGAKVTDIVIIVVGADDGVMPQTKEAINHAQLAGVPIIIAINKVDKPNANPDKIKEELANMNILVEDWGGKYQSQEISAKKGTGVEDLLEKVLLEAEVLELKANPNKGAIGTVIEATLDKGRGYVTTVLVQAGTLHIGDIMLAGAHFGKVKAMFDHLGNKLTEVGPSMPVQMLGLDGAPQSGDKMTVTETEKEAREISTKRQQIIREQSFRTKKHITLDEIGRRLAIGSFQELNIIVKGDVDGSVEALSDSLLKLSTDEIKVNIIHKGVGQITESDVLLATASDAIIVGFQVRPSAGAKNIAEQEQIEIRTYSIIYKAIEEVKDAMEGMLAPDVEEVITGNIEVRDVFKISRVGTVAGCYVTDGYVKRNNPIRLVRDGVVVYSGEIQALKRFKDDVNEVKSGFECGISIKDFNDIKVGDVIEGYEEREVKRTL